MSRSAGRSKNPHPGRTLLTLLALPALVAVVANCAGAAKPAPTGQAAARSAGSAARDTAVFAGGCFWSMQTDFERRPGVVRTTVGYTGGHTVNPSYEDVTTETTGHSEAVEVVFDPAKTSYAKLLDLYWHSIDPTQADGQMFDRGSSYMTVVYYRNEAQHQAALASKRAIEASGALKAPIATQIRAAGPFYRAEEYHQEYGRKNPVPYGAYRLGSGRDRRIDEVWGKVAAHPEGY